MLPKKRFGDSRKSPSNKTSNRSTDSPAQNTTRWPLSVSQECQCWKNRADNRAADKLSNRPLAKQIEYRFEDEVHRECA